MFTPVPSTKTYVFHRSANENNPDIREETIRRKYNIAPSSLERQYVRNILLAKILSGEGGNVKEEYKKIIPFYNVSYTFFSKTYHSLLKELGKIQLPSTSSIELDIPPFSSAEYYGEKYAEVNG